VSEASLSERLSERLNESDRQLAALGPVPADVRALIAPYVGEVPVSPASADELLAALGVATLSVATSVVPSRLMPTEVDMPAPAAATWDLSAESFDQEAPPAPGAPSAPPMAAAVNAAVHSSESVFEVSTADEARDEGVRASFAPARSSEWPAAAEASATDTFAAPSSIALVSDDAGTGDWALSADAVAEPRNTFASEPPSGRAPFPWESEPPPAMPSAAPVEAALPRRRDTIEQEMGDELSSRLASAPGLELPEPTSHELDAAAGSDEDAQSLAELAAVDAALDAGSRAPAPSSASITPSSASITPSSAPITPSSAPSTPRSNAPSSESSAAPAEATDEFEIMVDDDILEIDDGDVEIMDDDA
jgi:hypothetical protein